MQPEQERRLQIPLSQFMTVILATVLALSLMNFALTAIKSYRLRHVELELKAEIKAEQEEQGRLLDRKRFVQSEQYQRQLAHELGLYAENERPLVLVLPPEMKGEFEEVNPVFRTGQQLEKPYWQQWWDLFFGSDDLESLTR
ncbi:MAG: hypothetical protein M5U01_23295 [Ardenticatenaceae bacterium]|nr:hypothetical protein [Ardenticatenaceae bacterium]HBY98280.1 hypothetical protein [Chloroflexota bacterium]